MPLRHQILVVLLFAGCAHVTPSVPQREFRGVWLTTVNNADWPSRPGLSTEEQKAELIAILDCAKAMHLNAVVMHIRPHGDALYQSDIEPWSDYITGELGKARVGFNRGAVGGLGFRLAFGRAQQVAEIERGGGIARIEFHHAAVEPFGDGEIAQFLGSLRFIKQRVGALLQFAHRQDELAFLIGAALRLLDQQFVVRGRK